MADDEENDPNAPFNELEAFDSLWQALKWKQIRKRIPICFQKTIHNRYFLANIVYLAYAIGILIVDFDPWVNGTSESDDTDDTCLCALNSTDPGPIFETYTVFFNRMYLILSIVHVISATLYWWAWKGHTVHYLLFSNPHKSTCLDHRWNDVIMIPEYLNHIEASLYLWSSALYPYEQSFDDEITLRVHRIEMSAALVELIASFGWIMSWYRTYTRTIGRGYTLNDPDVVAFVLTTLSSFIYITYYTQILMNRTEDGSNLLFTNADIIYFVGAVFYLLANLRDDGWFWWMPDAGQYGIAAGKVDTGKPLKVGLRHMMIGGSESFARCCRCCGQNRGQRVEPADDKRHETNSDLSVVESRL